MRKEKKKNNRSENKIMGKILTSNRDKELAGN